MAILNRIRQLRAESDGLSQAQLAKQIDVSRQTLNAIERGQRLPSQEIAHRIADTLNRSLDDVFHYESEFPAKDDDDGQMTIIVRIDDEPEWWKSDDVSRVTTKRSAVVTRRSEPAFARIPAATCKFSTSDDNSRNNFRPNLSKPAPTQDRACKTQGKTLQEPVGVSRRQRLKPVLA